MHKPGRIRSERWREIALICRATPRTVPAIARTMNVEPGSIRSLILSMRRENLLEETESEARGVALKLTSHGRAELKRHSATGGADGLLTAGERLVFLIDEGRGPSSELLAEFASDPSFRWATRIDGTVKWIISFGPDEAVAADRAANTANTAGLRAVVGRTDAFFDAAGLTSYAKKLTTQRPITLRQLGAAQNERMKN